MCKACVAHNGNTEHLLIRFSMYNSARQRFPEFVTLITAPCECIDLDYCLCPAMLMPVPPVLLAVRSIAERSRKEKRKGYAGGRSQREPLHGNKGQPGAMNTRGYPQ